MSRPGCSRCPPRRRPAAGRSRDRNPPARGKRGRGGRSRAPPASRRDRCCRPGVGGRASAGRAPGRRPLPRSSRRRAPRCRTRWSTPGPASLPHSSRPAFSRRGTAPAAMAASASARSRSRRRKMRRPPRSISSAPPRAFSSRARGADHGRQGRGIEPGELGQHVLGNPAAAGLLAGTGRQIQVHRGAAARQRESRGATGGAAAEHGDARHGVDFIRAPGPAPAPPLRGGPSLPQPPLSQPPPTAGREGAQETSAVVSFFRLTTPSSPGGRGGGREKRAG